MKIKQTVLFLVMFSLIGIFGETGNTKIKNPIKEVKKIIDNDKKDDKDKKDKKDKKEVKYDYEMKSDSDLYADVLKMLPPKSQFTHDITEGVFGPADGTNGPIKIVPYVIGDAGKLHIMLLVPGEKQKYKKMMLGEVKLGANNVAEVLSVFFDQSDKDKERELFVLCSYAKDDQYFYETVVFDWKKNKFVRVPQMESRIKNLYPAINVRRALRAMESEAAAKKKK